MARFCIFTITTLLFLCIFTTYGRPQGNDVNREITENGKSESFQAVSFVKREADPVGGHKRRPFGGASRRRPNSNRRRQQLRNRQRGKRSPEERGWRGRGKNTSKGRLRSSNKASLFVRKRLMNNRSWIWIEAGTWMSYKLLFLDTHKILYSYLPNLDCTMSHKFVWDRTDHRIHSLEMLSHDNKPAQLLAS